MILDTKNCEERGVFRVSIVRKQLLSRLLYIALFSEAPVVGLSGHNGSTRFSPGWQTRKLNASLEILRVL
jgi:hypothetical protein